MKVFVCLKIPSEEIGGDFCSSREDTLGHLLQVMKRKKSLIRTLEVLFEKEMDELKFLRLSGERRE